MPLDEQFGTERETLEAHLEQNREIAISKVRGLPWDQAMTRLGASATSAAGIIRHLTDVERWWFRRFLAGENEVPFRWSDTEEDLEFLFTDDDNLDAVIADYEAACAESRSISARYELTDQAVRADHTGERPSLRWIYVHMIEETARHNGHLDIYRELLDGQVGYRN
jgi:uncharacterized damage-inducible protein DinB